MWSELPDPDPESTRSGEPHLDVNMVSCCLTDFALGDALGHVVEKSSFEELRSRRGQQWVYRLPEPGHFTANTQLMLFTCEGLIRTSIRTRSKGITADVVTVLYHAYLRWAYTQGDPWPPKGKIPGLDRTTTAPDGWLVNDRRMHHAMSPGPTTLAALRSGRLGTLERRINSSAGCKAVMRGVPCGLIMGKHGVEEAYGLGCRAAAITHGHDDAIHATGACAVIVAELVRGVGLDEALRTVFEVTTPRVAEAIQKGLDLARHGTVGPKTISSELGSGRKAVEALSIALCCTLAAEDAASAVLASVNHPGDADSTGALTGSLASLSFWPKGAYLGTPYATDLVATIAADLHLEFTQPPEEGGVNIDAAPGWWWMRYPGW